MSRRPSRRARDRAVAELWPLYLRALRIVAETSPDVFAHAARFLTFILNADHPTLAQEMYRLAKIIDPPKSILVAVRDLEETRQEVEARNDAKRRSAGWLRRQLDSLEVKPEDRSS